MPIFFTKYYWTLLFPVFAHGQQYTMDYYHPKEVIQQLEIDSCKIYDSSPSGINKLSQLFIYDKAGNVVERHLPYKEYVYQFHYNSDHALIRSTEGPFDEPHIERDTFIYTPTKELIQRISFDSDGKESRRYEYSYGDGKMIKEVYFLKGRPHLESKFLYTKDGRLAEETTYFKGYLDRTESYTYDRDQRMIRFEVKYTEEKPGIVQEFIYNDLGLLMEQRISNNRGELSQVYLTNYNPNGLIASKESYTSIKNNNIETAKHKKKVYVYTHRT